ncbi:MAG: excinuclease ABC subunit UvrB [Christensenellaceae bacterium]|jgi:excinuclease ABC subunit B|nr:excinuclease ABC subunit UvrB [Christensenellaceae bacterium]
MRFEIGNGMVPRGDQPAAIDRLAAGIEDGLKAQVLLGVTGSGKTFTMANVIERVQRPTLVLAHNKTLAAQLCAEFKEIFPHNAVEYFVSYYDYYQPEAYIASTDTYIEKDSAINDEIDRLRHSATASLQERRDVIVVSSVSCIYSMGDPSEYENMALSLREGMNKDRDEVIRLLIDNQYERNDLSMERGTFRVRGDIVDVIPVGQEKKGIRLEFFGDELERISEIDVLTGSVTAHFKHVIIFPATHYVVPREKLEAQLGQIEQDLLLQIKKFKGEDKLLEAQRIEQRTLYDIEMLREVGMCAGIENYSRYFDGRQPGQAPFTLLDYFPKDFLLMVDESHATIPQVRAMFAGDFSRKKNLVEYGFRLPSAFDNRPLRFDEFEDRIGQCLFVSATPAAYELQRAGQVVEQIIRPTGLIDPEIVVVPAQGQVDDLVGRLREVTARGNRALVTTLTKRMAESLTDYLKDLSLKVRYLHSDVDTLERIEILRDLRLGAFDVLVGINLLREGLDLPEVEMVAILDADKEGFLRSETSLIQTIGRAARNVDGKVIMYADTITDSMRAAIDETNRRREKQMLYNEEHHIKPETVRKAVAELLVVSRGPDEGAVSAMDEDEKRLAIEHIEEQMLEAAGKLDFEKAAKLRDQMLALKGEKVVQSAQQQRGRKRRRPRR